ncbi:hypothetical protein EV426DRAFT_602645 [Tirmania nivea]|nr:hypothetical protein EV426DRAFT_602645 [Tirmania nivea]
MGIPTYTTEKPSNSTTTPSTMPLCTETDIHIHNPPPPPLSESRPPLQVTSRSTAPAEINTNPAVARSVGPSSEQEPHVLTVRPTEEGALTQEEVDRLYQERMEEEYAKREGGA